MAAPAENRSVRRGQRNGLAGPRPALSLHGCASRVRTGANSGHRANVTPKDRLPPCRPQFEPAPFNHGARCRHQRGLRKQKHREKSCMIQAIPLLTRANPPRSVPRAPDLDRVTARRQPARRTGRRGLAAAVLPGNPALHEGQRDVAPGTAPAREPVGAARRRSARAPGHHDIAFGDSHRLVGVEASARWLSV